MQIDSQIRPIPCPGCWMCLVNLSQPCADHILAKWWGKSYTSAFSPGYELFPTPLPAVESPQRISRDIDHGTLNGQSSATLWTDKHTQTSDSGISAGPYDTALATLSLPPFPGFSTPDAQLSQQCKTVFNVLATCQLSALSESRTVVSGRVSIIGSDSISTSKACNLDVFLGLHEVVGVLVGIEK